MTSNLKETKNIKETPRILVIDADDTVRKSIAAMLIAEGYFADTAGTGKEAVKKTFETFYNLALINIRLQDMGGTDVMNQMKETVPPMIKVIIASNASLPKAVDAVNNGADACVLIPTDPEKLLNVVKKGLKKQEDAKKFSQQRVVDFIETRVRELSSTTNR